MDHQQRVPVRVLVSQRRQPGLPFATGEALLQIAGDALLVQKLQRQLQALTMHPAIQFPLPDRVIAQDRFIQAMRPDQLQAASPLPARQTGKCGNERRQLGQPRGGRAAAASKAARDIARAPNRAK